MDVIGAAAAALIVIALGSWAAFKAGRRQRQIREQLRRPRSELLRERYARSGDPEVLEQAVDAALREEEEGPRE